MAKGKLTPKQQAFVREYPIDKNCTQAAKRAGYSARTAYSAGQRLLKHVEVLRLIGKQQAKVAERAEITAETVLRRLSIESEGKGPDTSSSARTRATELLAKHLGMLIERSEVKNVDEFEGLSESDLRAKLDELREQSGTRH